MDIKSNILFKVAIYLRLSKEDGNFSSNGKFESNSINSQREIIMNYLKEHPEMEIYELTTEDVLSSSAANEDFDVTDGEW